MSDISRQIDKQNISIKSDFRIKQFKLSNNTQYPIYINISGQVPSVSKYDYLIQPKNDFVSPAIDTTILTIYTTIVSTNVVATIYCYSEVVTSPSNTASISIQNLGSLPNYPVLLNASSTGSLPFIYITTLKNIYFLIRNNGVPVLFQLNFGIVGHVQGSGGIVTIEPNVLESKYSVNNFLQPLILIDPQQSLDGILVDAVLTDNAININNPIPTFQNQLDAIYTSYFIAKPPGFVFSQYIINNKGVNYNYNYTVTIYLVEGNNATGQIGTFVIYNRTFTGIALTGVSLSLTFQVRNNFQIVTGYRFARILVANNLAPEPQVSVFTEIYDL